ncbi:MAG: sigma-70 family RNA polymerase sigma factor [Planctomycetota bacterium]
MTTLTTDDRTDALAAARETADTPLVDLTDEQLLALHQSGAEDRPYFATLVARYERELYSFLRRYLQDAAMAEDAFQATFLQVHRKGHLFDSRRKFRPWLYTVATNRAIDLQRRNKRHQAVSLDRAGRSEQSDTASLVDLLPSSESGPGERFELAERSEWVRRAVASLPEQLQQAVALVYFRGLKYREAAAELSVPVGTVKSRLHSAVGRLGQQWRESHPQL